MKHLLSAAELSRDAVEKLFSRAEYFRGNKRVYHQHVFKKFRSYVVGTVFFEPSTRTRVSFQSAAQRFGAGVVDLGAAEMSSLVKGESEDHTVRYMAEYAEVLVIRHKSAGEVARLATRSHVPVINAGDGSGQHPTQALLDVFTMQQELKRTADGLRVVCCGDLLHSRTFNSLVDLLGLYRDVELVLCCPGWATPKANRKWPDGVKVSSEPVLRVAADKADVLYMLRPQKERHGAEPHAVYGQDQRLDDSVMKVLPDGAILMHPGPITDEIPSRYDRDPRAVYFRMARHGLHVRMAIIEHLIEENYR